MSRANSGGQSVKRALPLKFREPWFSAGTRFAPFPFLYLSFLFFGRAFYIARTQPVLFSAGGPGRSQSFFTTGLVCGPMDVFFVFRGSFALFMAPSWCCGFCISCPGTFFRCTAGPAGAQLPPPHVSAARAEVGGCARHRGCLRARPRPRRSLLQPLRTPCPDLAHPCPWRESGFLMSFVEKQIMYRFSFRFRWDVHPGMTRHHVMSPQLTAGGVGHGHQRSAGPADVGSPLGITASGPGLRQHVVPERLTRTSRPSCLCRQGPRAPAASYRRLFSVEQPLPQFVPALCPWGCPEPFLCVAEATTLGLRGPEGGWGHSRAGGRPSSCSARSAR